MNRGKHREECPDTPRARNGRGWPQWPWHHRVSLAESPSASVRLTSCHSAASDRPSEAREAIARCNDLLAAALTSQLAKGLVHRLGRRKLRGDVRIQENNVRALAIPLHVLPTHTTGEIVFG